MNTGVETGEALGAVGGKSVGLAEGESATGPALGLAGTGLAGGSTVGVDSRSGGDYKKHKSS
ncbi:hypothetical protein HW132_35270 [Brasilonema sp. CT11]|nr:hypothetical protein [Brasilonema sp. CT11]